MLHTMTRWQRAMNFVCGCPRYFTYRKSLESWITLYHRFTQRFQGCGCSKMPLHANEFLITRLAKKRTVKRQLFSLSLVYSLWMAMSKVKRLLIDYNSGLTGCLSLPKDAEPNT